MANFPSFTFTAAGRAAITRSLSGKDVDRPIITKCVLGDGVYSGDIDSLKDVTSPKMTVTVSEYTDNGDGTSVTRFVYDNASLDAGFMHREMGIYAKNGDSGTELLLCYSNAGDEYSYIRAGTVDSVTKQRKATMPPQTFKFVLATGGSGSVNAVIDPKGYVDVEMLEEHNTDPTAHPDIRQKLNAVDAKANTNASNITALQTSDNAKFKAVSVSNDTLTFTKGDNTTTAVTVNNVANATNASYTTTQDSTDNSTKIASTAFVRTAVANIVNSAPSTLDTLNELANALGNDPNFATTVSTQIGQKADKTELDNKLALHNADVTAHNGIINTIPKINIITGTCADGQTIPLPDGYTESQCTIFVSMMKENPNGYWCDVSEEGARDMLQVECYTEGRILRCAMIFAGFDGWRTGRDSGSFVGPRIGCVANYMVIGIKYGG